MKSSFLVLLCVFCLPLALSAQSTKVNLPDGSGQVNTQFQANTIWNATQGRFVLRDSADGQAAAQAAGTSQAVTPSTPATTSFPAADGYASVSSTPVVVKNAAGAVYAWSIYNPNTSAVFLKVYNSATPTVGTTTPRLFYVVPAQSQLILPLTGYPHGTYNTAISIAAVTSDADNSTTAPTNPIRVRAAVQ